MAGFDTVDPAYACVLPVSPVVSRSPTPRSRRIVPSPKNIRSPIGLGSFPDPRDIPAFADQASQAKSRVLTMKAKRKTAPSKPKRKAASSRRAKDIAQFAPNFTVYTLPPDQVCLYSED